MKRMLGILILFLLILSTASAELAMPLFTPTPAPATPFECEAFRLLLPYGLEILDAKALEGYEAALEADYPGAAENLLAAADAENGKAIFFAAIQSTQAPQAAAQEAAQALLGNASLAAETNFGANPCASFACAIGDQDFSLYWFSNGEQIILAALSGLTGNETSALLESLVLA